MNKNPPSQLWHYTSKEATLGILGSSSLWATSILYLNDADEFHQVRHLVSEWIARTRQENSLGFPDSYRLLSGRQSVFVHFLQRQLTSRKALHTYVASLSELSDDLSQWRAYGTSGGFSLGFQRERLSHLAGQQGFVLYECVYDEDVKAELVNGLMEEAILEFASVDATITDDDLSSGLGIYADLQPSTALSALGDRFFLRAQQVACRIKSNAFQSEREWRIVSVKQPEPAALNFRSSKSMLIPFVKFKLAPDDEPTPLAGLTVGPSAHASLNLMAVAELCRSKTISGLAITKTKISYRDW